MGACARWRPAARSLAVLLLSAVLPLTGVAASFACAKASSNVEQLICKDAELSALDEHLAQHYAAARQVLADAGTCLQAQQRGWLQARRDACKDATCLKQVYLERLAELSPLQAGATMLRDRELPKVPALEWVIPPAKDTVAAPPRRDAKPLVVRGSLVNEVAQGDGYVMRTPDGRRHLLLMAMFLDGPSVDRLAALAKRGAETFEARGVADGSWAPPRISRRRAAPSSTGCLADGGLQPVDRAARAGNSSPGITENIQ